MDRQEVYKLIDGEREYQNNKWNRPETDQNHSLADWAIYLEFTVNQMKKDLYYLNYEEAKNCVRKIAGLAVACMEHNETQPRQDR